MTTTRYRIGPRQLAILRELASHGRLITAELAWDIDHCESGDGWKYSVVLPAIRRSLAELKAKGLVTNGGDVPGSREYAGGMRGRPTIWNITDAGREYLARHDKAGTTPAREDT